jgi:hypothetical protein
MPQPNNVNKIIYIIILLIATLLSFSQEDNRASISNGQYSVTADSIELDSKSKTAQADGFVMVKDIDKFFIADSLFMRYEQNFNGELHNADGYIKPFHFTGKIIMLSEDGSATIHTGTVTTCSHKKPHYCFIVDDLNLSSDHTEINLNKAGFRIFGITLRTSTQFKININDDNKDMLPIFPGYSSIDGFFIETVLPYQLTDNLSSKTQVRYGTAAILRGSETLTYKIPYKISGIHPTLSVTGAYRDESPYNIAGGIYRDQTYSKLPEYSLTIPKLPVFKLAGQWRLTSKANYGEYLEYLSKVRSTRADASLILESPRKIIGNTATKLVIAGNKYYYPGKTRGTNYIRLTVDKKKNEGFYWKAAYQHLHDSGGSPFFFDRTLLKDELETGIEFNLMPKSPWRAGITNIQDLDNGRSNDLQVKLKYNFDCMSYNLTYSRATASAWFGVEMKLE